MNYQSTEQNGSQRILANRATFFLGDHDGVDSTVYVSSRTIKISRDVFCVSRWLHHATNPKASEHHTDARRDQYGFERTMLDEALDGKLSPMHFASPLVVRIEPFSRICRSFS